VFDALIDGSLRQRPLVVLLLLGLTCSGVYSLLHLPIDAVPDITNTQVMALTSAPALGPLEIEQFITIPVENAMNGIPRIREVRSFSQFGISGVTIIFSEGTDIYWARQQVAERLVQVRSEIPAEFGQPEMGPIATGLGEIYQFEVRNERGAAQPKSLMELRTILDWEVARRLKGVPGVVEVNALGGELKTYTVELDPDRLQARGIALDRVFEAIRRNNVNAGGGYIQGPSGELRVIRGVGLISKLTDLESVVLAATPDGTPIRVGDVGKVRFAPMIRQGAATRDGRGEAVTAIVYLLAGENGRVVVDRIKAKVEEIQKILPDGMVIEPYYDRSVLIGRTIATVARNLVEGGVLVVVVLLVFLGNIKAGLIVALAIPLSMLFAGNFMLLFGIAGSLMSLGAIDFGLIVDSAVIVVENCVGRLAHAQPGADAMAIVGEATREVRRPVVFGVAIITLVHLPILALEGVEGKMFRPLALTVIFALTGSLLLSLTATPVLASFFLRSGMSERDTLPIRLAKRIYEPILPRVLDHPVRVFTAAIGVFALCIPVALGLGGEFIPRLDEGDILIAQTRPPSTSLNESIAEANLLEQALLKEFPDEVRSVISRIGRPEIGLEAAGVNLTDTWVMVKDPEHWTRAHDKEELIDQIDAICKRVIPGCAYSFSQPIEMRFNELLAGVRSDLGIGVRGDDLDELQRLADQIAGLVRKVPGAAGVRAQVIGGLPFLRIEVDRDRIARHEINAADVLDAVSALGGKIVGQVVEGQRRFDLQVRFGARYRNDIETIRNLKIADPKGRLIALEDLTTLHNEDDTFEIWRKDRQRRIMVQANVRGRDLASFVAQVQSRIAAEIVLPRGYSLEWGGTFENLQSATHRLALVIPLALALIFLLLYSTFQSIRLGTLIFLSVPFAAIGGVLALWLRGLNFSISAGVGFIALSGVAVLDGLVLVASIRQNIERSVPMRRAISEAAVSRLRPILMVATVASLGLLPMAISHGAGAEVQRPLATVVIGGLITSVLLKLLVLPSIYPWFDPGLPDGPSRPEPAPAGPPVTA
jgi:cobalt-zinc-cadmium resistance protein CzcA